MKPVDPLLPATSAVRLGDSLRARRKQLGINMIAAAEAAGISRVTWHRLEKGEPSVAWGSLLAAAAVLGLELCLARTDDDARSVSEEVEVVPRRIRLADHPGLRRLAWQVSEDLETLTPREAYGLYARNARHLVLDRLPERERRLLRTLQDLFGEVVQGV